MYVGVYVGRYVGMYVRVLKIIPMCYIIIAALQSINSKPAGR